jgi:hypothetical protein
MSQLPIYVQYLTAISTPIIALLVAMIAFAQWRTAHQRMILDLFQRRMDPIDLVSRIAAVIMIEGALRKKTSMVSYGRSSSSRLPPMVRNFVRR